MAITKGYTFGATELITNTKLHTMIDSATLSSVADSSLSKITTANKISGSALTDLVFIDETLVSYNSEVMHYSY